MTDILLNSGVLSVSLWLGLAVVLALLYDTLVFRRTAPASIRRSALPGLFGSALFLVFLGLGAAFNLSFALLKAYAAPRDVMQDVVSAQEFLAGRSMYPEHMNALILETLRREPELLSSLPFPQAVRERLAARRQQSITDHWVQAHPPLMTLFVVPFVALGGTLLTQAVMLVLSLAALGVSLWLIGRRLDLRLHRRQTLMLVFAILGAEPVIVTLRLGQSGLLLTVLLVLAWDALHRGRPVLAGIAVGVAASLKMFPALLLVYFLARHRRAFVAAMITILLLLGFVVAIAGSECLFEYRQTASGVVAEYEAFPSNLSLLGLFARLAGSGETGWSRVLFGCAGVAVLVLIVAGPWNPLGGEPDRGEKLDLNYALCVALMPLLSPIVWDHYLTVLVLPLMVLGKRVLRPSGSWPAVVGFLVLGMVLLVPDTAFTWPASRMVERVMRLMADVFLLPLRTYAVIALSCWLALLAMKPFAAEG